MYKRKNGLIIGFHGCDISVRDKIVCDNKLHLNFSDNDYDWLGKGIYFWENNYERAINFAEFLKKNPSHNSKQKIKTPAVIGAIIDLGYCFDLLETDNLIKLKKTYEYLKEVTINVNSELPQNTPFKNSKDLIVRKLDCAVINLLHKLNFDNQQPEFDSIRAPFFEGDDLYENAGFKEKNHIQIAVRNPNSIKGYFIPRDADKKYLIP